ncbi:unnamed protein product, partial [Prorocentrum cordatum]
GRPMDAGSALAAVHPSQEHRWDDPEWDANVVTVMIRQIPRHFTQQLLLHEVVAHGFEGLFDFLYLPWDLKKGVNVGRGGGSTSPTRGRP